MNPLTGTKLLKIPFVTDISSTVNPVTASLNVNVTGIGDVFVVETDEDIFTEGGFTS